MPQFAAAAGSGSFTPTGSMSVPREGAGAAPLPDGRVLVAAGYFYDGSDRFLASAEAFNSQAGSFSTAGIGSMGTARYFAAAAPLRDGRVLVTGGETPPAFAVTKTAEVFNPQTGAFSPVGSMEVARDGHAMALLPDGRVLVVGAGTPNAEVFDPQTNTFSSAGIGSMGTARSTPVAAPLGDGRVLVAGGSQPGTSTYFSSAEIFAATNTFSFLVKGKKLIVSVQASGGVSLSDAKAPLSAVASRKKRKLLLKPSSASGGPQTIIVPLRLTKLAKAKLRRRGKLSVRARITFKPQGGIANTQTAKLKIAGKKRKK